MPDLVVGSTKRRLDLQALRALAVIAVVLNHSWPGLAPGGYLGVDIFFVVSGYLITRHLAGEYVREKRIRLGRFYLRRARRLLPAATVVLAAVSIVTLIVIPVEQWEAFFRQILASTFYVQNWALVVPTAGPDVDTAVRHFWSLSVEEQFYLVWPMLVIVGATVATRMARPPRTVLAIISGAIVVASLAFWIVTSASDYQLAYFNTFARAWEFVAGGLLALLPSVVVRGRVADVTFWAGLAAIIASIALFADNPGAWSVIPVAGTITIIVACNEGLPRSAEALVSLRPVQWVGDISYALYLWHWPVLLFAPYVTGVPSPTWFMVILLGLAVLLSWATTRFVEGPVRRTPLEGDRFRPRRRAATLAVGAGLALTVGLSAAGSWVNTREVPTIVCLERGVQKATVSLKT